MYVNFFIPIFILKAILTIAFLTRSTTKTSTIRSYNMLSFSKMHIQTPQNGTPAGQPVRESLYNAFDSNMKIDRQAISQESKINKRYDAKRARAESKYKNPGVFDICILTRNLTSKMEKIEQARERALQKH
ncbi:unnamed protein product [Colletotrichum noveboracense]|uniref:Uncharacterized protein n=1 Tax=Colletotrichum noveboracense TaxID=2664923 RepID=A0A9W4RZI8_9PEZI|nr:hypothetical protein COL940_013730 [Colletotrichum noveboracense]KAJ0271505.1 hypothetical protein CBS470a_013105 [Colletotrichum nupharicola]KAJ0297870.1 hypothetical protein Brms1b_013513 [Colletotrichum noveboracense]CAI0649717.1 unnamed protein product [Colletotrichum noveboracense]